MSARSMGPGPALVGPRSGEPYATMSYLGSARSLPTRMAALAVVSAAGDRRVLHSRPGTAFGTHPAFRAAG